MSTSSGCKYANQCQCQSQRKAAIKWHARITPEIARNSDSIQLIELVLNNTLGNPTPRVCHENPVKPLPFISTLTTFELISFDFGCLAMFWLKNQND